MSRATLEVKLALPSLPSFVREQGNPKHLHDIADLEEETLREIGRQWTEALVKRAAVRRGWKLKGDR